MVNQSLDENRYTPFHWRECDARSILSPQLRAAHDAWQDEAASGDLPVWSIGVLESLPNEILPYANVINTDTGKPPFSYRFFGSGLANLHTFELSAKTTDAIEPAGFRNLCIDQHIRVITEQQPLVFINQIPTRTESVFLNHSMLRMPYSTDGETVSQILTLEEMDQSSNETWDRFLE